jgi:hypothetical protein
MDICYLAIVYWLDGYMAMASGYGIGYVFCLLLPGYWLYGYCYVYSLYF